ncbi:hypothetical protein [Lactiplantibacillus plantarum]|uniref:hypothetical protein n=1 Tax=Lactiplantibacillus plantarum TaxID=1590 RepID=UPI000F4FB671|nr:hypothetical protein [Lactiplantibacillus plantarum]
MKKHELLWVPVLFAMGAYVGHHFGHKFTRKHKQKNVEVTMTQTPLANQPVYIRETVTDGRGL